jgi:hypothetical protein
MTTITPTADSFEFRPEDRPTLPGGPYTPPHPPLRRLGYAAIGLWIGATATFANAMVTVNVANLSGEYAAYVAELSWFPAIFVAANSCTNTMLVKARQQFSLPSVMRVLLVVYILAGLARFFVPGFAAEAVVRFLSGVVAAGMIPTSVYYLMQALPPKARPIAAATGLGMAQLGTPLARLVPVDLLSAQGWFGQHCIELATGLVTLTLITLLPLPPTPRSREFQRLDFLTAALLVPATLLICGVLNRGRLAWWTDTPWLGLDLLIAVPLLGIAIVIEVSRERPLIRFGWLGTREFLAFAVIALLMRLALAEQTYGAVGLLTAGNLDNDQLRALFACVGASMLAGVGTCALTLSAKAVPWQVVAACLAIATGAWLDSHANNLTRPGQLYLSQSLIGFGTCLFIGPTFAFGMAKVIRLGPEYLVTLLVVFSTTQNVGGLLGSALLGSYETVASRAHFQELALRMPAVDPAVLDRVAGSTRALAGTVGDPALRMQQGRASLAAAVTKEANVLAFNDVFRFVWRLALITALLISALVLSRPDLSMPRGDPA